MSLLFSEIIIRGEKIRNRVFVAPMCQYSSENNDGVPTDWHMVHLGTRAVGGAGLVMAEATSVSPEGRISPNDLGIWNDQQAEQFCRITDFVTSQGATPAIQLAHAGRKASHKRPWEGNDMLFPSDDQGWEIVAPSSIPFQDDWATPNSLTIEDIDRIIGQFVESSKKSIAAGFKVIELHFAHGYLACEFMSSLSNNRKDEYGGSLKNRCKFPLDIVTSIRKVIPESMPLIVRISATEYENDGWTIDDSVELSGWLKNLGTDMIDCSSGGNSSSQKLDTYPGYQVQFSQRIRKEVDILTGAVGLITHANQAEQTLRSEGADVILLGRELLRNPYWPLHSQVQLDNQNSLWPDQYVRASNL